MDESTLKKLEDLLSPIRSALDKLSADMAAIKMDLVDKNYLKTELEVQKTEINSDICANKGKIQDISDSLEAQKVKIEELRNQIATAFPEMQKIWKKLIIVGDSLVKWLDVERICPGMAEDCILVCLPGARIGTVRRTFARLAGRKILRRPRSLCSRHKSWR